MDLTESSEVISTVVESEPSTPTVEPSRREEITKALEAKEQPESAEVKAQRARDESGKFVKQDKPADKPLETAPEKPEAPKRTYPKSWKKGIEKDFESVPETVYSEIARREEDIEKGFLRIGQIKEFYDELNSVINPYMPTINSLGVKPAQAIQQLLNTDHVLRNGQAAQKAQLFKHLAKSYGVDLGNLQTEAPNEVHFLQDKINNLENQIKASQQQSQNATLIPYINEVETFKAAHEHFEELRPIMASLLQSGSAADLKTAYDMALRTRSPAIDLDQERKKWAEEERQRIEKAKQAAVSVKGAPSTGPSSTNHHDRRAAIEAAITARSR